MLKVKAGQLDQLGLLFERYNKPLYGFFYRLTTDGVISEDLVQNVFVRIIKYSHTYKGDGKLITKMKTNRDIFTDFEAFSLSQPAPTKNQTDGRGFSIKFENWVEGDLNGGGAEVTMKTRNGNIYIRKN
jgi:hypothetical protein